MAGSFVSIVSPPIPAPTTIAFFLAMYVLLSNDHNEYSCIRLLYYIIY
jgi:hypothetical protein